MHERTRIAQPTLDRIGQAIWIQWLGLYDHVNTLLRNEVCRYRAAATQLFPALLTSI
jgi:hypothetical protein